MLIDKTTYKIAPILPVLLSLCACQSRQAETSLPTAPYSTVCRDADTSVKNDVPASGIPWSLTSGDLKEIVRLSQAESPRNIYVRNSITTCWLVVKDIEIEGSRCDMTLNAGAYGSMVCGEDEYGFGCYESHYNQYFPFPFEPQE